MRPLVSAVLTVKNPQEFLNITIDSVMAQTLKEYELLVIDCGSENNIEAIVKNYNDKRFRYIRLGNVSSKEGQKVGVKESKGKYIAIIEQDDLCHEERLKKQADILQKNSGVEVLGANFELFDLDGRVFEADKSTRNFVRQYPFASGSVMFRATLAKDVVSGKLDLSKWWLGFMSFKVSVAPGLLYGKRIASIPSTKKTDDDFFLWLSMSASSTQACSGPIESDYSKQPSARNRLVLEGLATACDDAWEKNELTYTQKLVVEEYSDKLQVDLTKMRNEMDGAPAVSVLMSVYNSEKYLREAMDSILNQSFKDFEFLVIDDGSSDRSIKIARTYQDSRIRIMHQTNHGLVYSFNKGIRLARAEFIARMDSDDITFPSRFRKQLDWLKEDEKRGLSATFFQYIDADTSKPTEVIMAYPNKHIDLLRMMYIGNPVGHGSVMMRKKAAEEVGGYRPEYEPAEDYDLWQRIARKWEIGLIPEILYYWRFHPASISRRKEDLSNAAAAKTVKNMWAGPVVYKSAFSIIRDAKYYRSLKPSLSKVVYSQYLSQQERIAKEMLIKLRVYAGWQTAIGTIWINPPSAKILWKPMLAAVKNSILGRR